jgi:hypothetical protein
MALPQRALTADDTAVSIHGRRLGLAGDGSAGDTSALLLDGKVVASSRGKLIVGVAAGNNGAGAITVAGTVPGDAVVLVTNLSTPANASASFEGTVSVAGQVQQTSASNLSGSTFQFLVDPRS